MDMTVFDQNPDVAQRLARVYTEILRRGRLQQQTAAQDQAPTERRVPAKLAAPARAPHALSDRANLAP